MLPTRDVHLVGLLLQLEHHSQVCIQAPVSTETAAPRDSFGSGNWRLACGPLLFVPRVTR